MRQTARFSFLSLLRQGTGKPWDGEWRDAPPKASYRVVIVGAVGHGVETAYYLAWNFGIRDLVVPAKAWLVKGAAAAAC